MQDETAIPMLQALPIFFFFFRHRNHRALHSFPTRRSSDLGSQTRTARKRFRRQYGRFVHDDAAPIAMFSLFDRYASSRSEEHTSELQSQFHLVCRLLLEKKINKSKSIFCTNNTN